MTDTIPFWPAIPVTRILSHTPHWSHMLCGTLIRLIPIRGMHHHPSAPHAPHAPLTHLGCSLRAGSALYVALAATPSRWTNAVSPSLDTATPILTGCLAAPVHWVLQKKPSRSVLGENLEKKWPYPFMMPHRFPRLVSGLFHQGPQTSLT